MILRCMSAKDLLAMSKVAVDFEQIVFSVIVPRRFGIKLKSRRLDLSFSLLESTEYILILLVVIKTGCISHLNLSECDLTRVSPDVLSKAVSNVSSANLYKTRLLNIQVERILKHSLKSSKLTHLNMGKVKSFSSVTPMLLGQAVKRLKVAEFSAASLSSSQVKRLFYIKLTTLEQLDLSYIDLTNINDTALCKTALRLEKISLWGNHNLTTLQLLRLVSMACMEDSTLKEIQVSRHHKLLQISPKIALNNDVLKIV